MPIPPAIHGHASPVDEQTRSSSSRSTLRALRLRKQQPPTLAEALVGMTRRRWKTLAFLLLVLAAMIALAVADPAHAQEAVGSAPSPLPVADTTMGSVTDVALESAPWLTLATLLVREGVSAFREWTKSRTLDADKTAERAEDEERKRIEAERKLARAEAALDAAGFTEDARGRWHRPGNGNGI